MGKIDSETNAILNQLKFEQLEKTPGAEIAEIAISFVTSLINPGLGLTADLFFKLRKLAATNVENNLICAMEAVVHDLAALSTNQRNLRDKIESLATDPQFVAAMSFLALQAMRTSTKERLKRLARIVVNGVRDEELEPESLDDMLRAATQLTEDDLRVLKKVAETQNKNSLISHSLSTGMGTINAPREIWQKLDQEGFITESNQWEIRSSLARLQSVGFGTEVQTMESMWIPRFVVTPAGEKFLRALRDIAE
jgi:hypothetical protein